MKEIPIKPPYIKLGQLIKFIGIIPTGGDEKFFLLNNIIMINGIKDERRGRKIYIGDNVVIKDITYKIVERNE